MQLKTRDEFPLGPSKGPVQKRHGNLSFISQVSNPNRSRNVWCLISRWAKVHVQTAAICGNTTLTAKIVDYMQVLEVELVGRCLAICIGQLNLDH